MTVNILPQLPFHAPGEASRLDFALPHQLEISYHALHFLTHSLLVKYTLQNQRQIQRGGRKDMVTARESQKG